LCGHFLFVRATEANCFASVETRTTERCLFFFPEEKRVSRVPRHI